MRQTSAPEHALQDEIAARRSPRSFEARAPSAAELRSMLEAARWAASCYNDQPWQFLVAARTDRASFERLLACLHPGNESWASGAGALIVSVAREDFAKNGRPNRHAWHDCGLALAQLSLQAGALGWAAHAMAGFDAERVREACAIPQGFAPVAAIAIGRPADPATLPPEAAARERAPRLRRPQRDFVFGTDWGRPLELEDEREWEALLALWFGAIDADGRAEPACAERWWKSDPAFDAELRRRFGALHAAVARGERSHWAESARGRLAAILVLDQLSRNLHRGSAEMFAQDGAALRLALDGIERGHDRALLLDERCFHYMPLMHAEDLELQERCVQLFRELHDEVPEALRPPVARQLDFAERHRDIVARWGRFPHRNAALGRGTTAQEQAFLQTPGSSF